MAISSSRGSHRTTTWAVDQKPRSLPRVVRLGRAANDNTRQTGINTRLFIVVAVTTLVMVRCVLLAADLAAVLDAVYFRSINSIL